MAEVVLAGPLAQLVGGAAARAARRRASAAASRTRLASSITWLEISSVVAGAGRARGTIAHSSARSTGSSPTVGSSSTSSSGSLEQRRGERHARALAARRACRRPGPRGRRARRSRSPRRSARGRADDSGEVAQVLLDAEVRRRPTAPGSRSRRGRRSSAAPAGRPSTLIVPPATICTPTIARISVVLPQPLGPSSPVTEPRGTASESPCRTSRPPRCTRRSANVIALSTGDVTPRWPPDTSPGPVARPWAWRSRR